MTDRQVKRTALEGKLKEEGRVYPDCKLQYEHHDRKIQRYTIKNDKCIGCPPSQVEETSNTTPINDCEVLIYYL